MISTTILSLSSSSPPPHHRRAARGRAHVLSHYFRYRRQQRRRRRRRRGVGGGVGGFLAVRAACLHGNCLGLAFPLSGRGSSGSLGFGLLSASSNGRRRVKIHGWLVVAQHSAAVVLFEQRSEHLRAHLRLPSQGHVGSHHLIVCVQVVTGMDQGGVSWLLLDIREKTIEHQSRWRCFPLSCWVGIGQLAAGGTEIC